MGAPSLTAVGMASAVFTLSKAAWKLGICLSKLDQDAKIVDTMIKNLAEEVKSLGIECDLLYTELEEVACKSGTTSLQPCDVDVRTWECLATQVEETSRTMQELELLVKSVRGENSNFISQAQSQKRLDKSKDQIARTKTKVCRHTDNLRTTLLLIKTILAPCRADGRLSRELDQLQDMVKKLQRSEADPQSRPSHTEATLMQYARDVIVESTTIYEGSTAAGSVAEGQGATSNTRIAEWVHTLDCIRRDQRWSDPLPVVSEIPPVISGEEAHGMVTRANSVRHAVQELEAPDAIGDNSDDDLDTDLARAALATGTTAFEAREWEEADSLLQEALRTLQQLPKEQSAICDIFSMHYKLAVCAYHMQEPAVAEEALMSLVQQSATSNEQRRCIYDATHLLSLLYIRIGQVDCARSECEKALQARRRLLGKLSDTSLESTVLMAHIYVLLNNRARAKSFLAMIPEARRDAIIKRVEESLGTEVEHLDFSSLLTRPVLEDSDLAAKRVQSRLSTSTLGLSMENCCYGPVSTTIKSPNTGLRQAHQPFQSKESGSEDLRSITTTSLLSVDELSESRDMEKERRNEENFAHPEALGAGVVSLSDPIEANESFKGRSLSRKDILDKIGCQPRDRTEEAVCDGDFSALVSLLNKRKDSWRSKLRKRVRPERVTALHFAALFGEIDMARLLLSSHFNINEVPYGYSTRLTPLKFAIGARQVDMAEFLIANGAEPSEPDSWSTLAGQLLSRSWLVKTMSEAERDFVPNRIVAILSILLRYGWDVNAPFETSGKTVLHQAVTFWTGSYRWDLNLRAAVTSFLCERGADPLQPDTEGKTPYDMASSSGHQDLLLVFDRYSRKNQLHNESAELAELSG